MTNQERAEEIVGKVSTTCQATDHRCPDAVELISKVLTLAYKEGEKKAQQETADKIIDTLEELELREDGTPTILIERAVVISTIEDFKKSL